ncbi:MCE family protein [Gordonia sp. TBRC 11910]|uniref:MCE family protein n=2 Tax=Gordonia asplenii TaxID=2725283 RepID=A0A848L3W2_9ACTN|nr:MCE family protein [Gordonia asplenii]
MKTLAMATVAAVGVVGSGLMVATSGHGITLTAAEAGGNGYCADLADAIGLYTGNPVTQMGMPVGKVTGVQAEGASVRVSFELNSGRAYPADVRAVTRSKSLLADRSLELVGNYTQGATLQRGQCISRDHTFTPKSISEIAGSASDFIKAMTDAGSTDVRDTVAGLDKALEGTSPDAANMFRHASNAALNPDQVIADIGSSIRDMAPLTTEALARWGTIDGLLAKAPKAASQGAELFSKDWVPDFCKGIGWLVSVLWDVQTNYGDSILWPLAKGPVRDIIELAATHAPDLKKLYETIPSIAATLKQQSHATGGLAIPYKAPTITDGRNSVDLFSLILAKAGTK